MILAHITGIPIEESVLQLAPAGAAIVTAVAIAGRMTLARMRGRLRDRATSYSVVATCRLGLRRDERVRLVPRLGALQLQERRKS